jgi:hypothetical protein
MACKVLEPKSILSGALALIGRPPSLLTRIGDLYDIMGNILEGYRNTLRIHDGNFILKSTTVTLAALSTTATITSSSVVSSWGRPVFCDVDPDALPAGVTLPKREIDVVAIQELDRYRAGLPNVQGTDVSTLPTNTYLVPTAVAWNREESGGNPIIKFYFEFGGYKPAQALTYRFFYEPGGIAEVMEGSNVDWLPEFVGLLQLDVARAFMAQPYIDMEPEAHQRLMMWLDEQVQRRSPVMHQFLQQEYREQSGAFEGYNRSRYGLRLNGRW